MKDVSHIKFNVKFLMLPHVNTFPATDDYWQANRQGYQLQSNDSWYRFVLNEKHKYDIQYADSTHGASN